MTFSDRILTLLEQFRLSGAVIDETIERCRADQGRCADDALLQQIKEIDRLGRTEGFATLRLYGQVGGTEFDIQSTTFQDVQNELLSLVIDKAVQEEWCYFLFVDRLAHALPGLVHTPVPKAVWVANHFAAFATGTLLFSPWGGPRQYIQPPLDAESPRRFVRDQTPDTAPISIQPWLLVTPPVQPSLIFTQWRSLAALKLAYALPFEIRPIDGDLHVALKGPRSAPIRTENPAGGWEENDFAALVDAATWVYSPRPHAEERFVFLNNQLSLAWVEGDPWPRGLLPTLSHNLVSARDAFAFYLQDQSKDALKTLGDLRKSLQEDVAKTQQATRDLLSTLWRDFAIAAVVLALRSPPISAATMIHPEVLRTVTYAAAGLLFLSLLVTLCSNARFNKLADIARAQWRPRLYSFLPNTDWQMLVENQLSAGKRVYRSVVVAMILVYLAAILYLLNLAGDGTIQHFWEQVVTIAIAAKAKVF